MPKTVDSNLSSLSYAAETSLQVLPGSPVWHPLEPNSYNSFGADLKTTMREPINAGRQRFKGSVTDIDVKAGFATDMTQDNITRLLQGFFFANAHEKARSAPINPTSPSATITAVAAGQYTASGTFGTVPVNSILKARGFTKSQNNGITRVTGVSGNVYSVSNYKGGGTEPALVSETPTSAAALEVVGYALHGDVLLYGPGSTFGGATVVQPLLSSAADVDFTTLGLQVGEWVYLGDNTDLLSDTSATEYNFIGSGTVRNRGYCRIVSITARALVFDLAIGSASWTAGGGAGGSVAVGTSTFASLYFGTVIHNESAVASIVRTSYTLQRYLGKNASNTDQLESLSGAVPDQLSILIPSNNKMTADLSFVAMNAAQSYSAALTGTYEALTNQAAYNTSADMVAMFLYLIDPTQAQQTPLFGYATDQKLTINNNTKPNKAIGVVGAFEANTGDFGVSGTLTCYFADIAAQQAVLKNSDVGLSNIFAKQNGGFIIDVPLVTIALPGLKVEKDKPIIADITHDASRGSNGFTLLYNKFHYLPDSAMAGYSS
jgi:hypothetical protein